MATVTLRLSAHEVEKGADGGGGSLYRPVLPEANTTVQECEPGETTQ